MFSSLSRKMVLCFSLLVAAGSSALSFGDGDTTEGRYARVTKQRYPTYVGVAGGLTTGYGISLRRWFNNTWALQVNFLPIYYEENYTADSENIGARINGRDSGWAKYGEGDLGLTYLRSMVEGRFVRTLFYVGANWGASYRNYNYYATRSEFDDSARVWTDSVVHKSGRIMRNTGAVGGGVGCEFFVWRFAFHVMGGLRAAYIIETKSPSVGPSVEVGVHFRF